MSTTVSAESEPNLDSRNTRRMKSGTNNENRGSVLLKPEENEQVFRLIGNRCQCLAAGVCQLYLTEAPAHREWIKKTVGVITLIKDVPRRSFYLRLYCLQRRACVWEHEVYNSMEYKSPLHYFHTFEAEDCMAAFNFANETDAITLKNILLEKLNTSKHKRQDKLRKCETETARESATLPRKSPSSTLSPMSALVSASSATLLNGSAAINKSVSSSFMSKKKDKKKKKESRLSKDQIGLPTDFRHITHMNWNPENKGMELESLDSIIDPSLRKMIKDVGISEKKMMRKKMQEYIYDFIDSYQQQEDMQEKRNERVPPPDLPSSVPAQKANTPPPIPVRTIPVNMNSKAYQARSAPPLPPTLNQSSMPTPPPAPTAPPVQRTIPTRPPPPLNSSGTMLPPPPPPPPLPSIPAVPARDSNTAGDSASAAPPPPPPPLPIVDNGAKGDILDPRSQLMESIRSGATTLRKVNKEELKAAPVMDTRNDLLNQIRQGIELKPVTVSNEPKATPPTSVLAQSGVAGALLRALAERARAIHSDSEDSTSDSSDDDDVWDD